ncbi:MAG: hypothetical protein IJC63_06225, partial [Myxococcaceae bacterium]|nr:hypothetical protein [Myxococcaceae bacterium]
MNVHKVIKTIRNKTRTKKNAQQKTNCRAPKHEESHLRSAEAVFEMPRAETHFGALRPSGNASFEYRAPKRSKTLQQRGI